MSPRTLRLAVAAATVAGILVTYGLGDRAVLLQLLGWITILGGLGLIAAGVVIYRKLFGRWPAIPPAPRSWERYADSRGRTHETRR